MGHCLFVLGKTSSSFHPSRPVPSRRRPSSVHPPVRLPKSPWKHATRKVLPHRMTENIQNFGTFGMFCGGGRGGGAGGVEWSGFAHSLVLVLCVRTHARTHTHTCTYTCATPTPTGNDSDSNNSNYYHLITAAQSIHPFSTYATRCSEPLLLRPSSPPPIYSLQTPSLKLVKSMRT